MRKLIVVLTIFLAICITIGAVSADDGWSFNFSSSESSSSNGGSIHFDNGKLKIQDIELTIPEGFKENDTAKKVGEKADEKTFPGFSYSLDEFDKGNESIIVKVIYGEEKMDKDKYTPDSNAQSKKIGDQDGYLRKLDDGVSFIYIKDGKLVDIVAPNEDVVASLFK